VLAEEPLHARQVSDLAIHHICGPARQHAHALAKTSAFTISQRARRKLEALFAELKNYIGLRAIPKL
jgi:hypothetical protein